MAPPKRQRGETSTPSSQQYDRRRFVSEEAQDLYTDSLEAKTLIPERGLEPGVMQGSLRTMIRERRWGVFQFQPDPAVISIVKEFYANADGSRRSSTVRGRQVSFSPTTINAYYQVPDIPQDDGYTEFKRAGIDEGQIMSGLCQPDAHWVIRDGQVRHFAHKYLSKYGKAWYYFICAKLLPTTHVSDVTRARAILLYSLVHGHSINIGNIISGSIRSAVEGGSSGGLPHPSLITGLCLAAGASWADSEPLSQPKVLIDARLIDHYTQWDGAPMDPRGAGFLLDQRSPSPEPQDPEPAVPEPTLASLTADVRQLQRESRRQTRRMDFLSQHMQSMASYQSDFNQTLVQLFERAGFNSGPDPLQFPPPPPAPAFPPDSPEGDAI